jgi:serralysin
MVSIGSYTELQCDESSDVHFASVIQKEYIMLSFDTTQPAQVQGLNGWTTNPIFTVGEKIGDYVPPGILDGIGAYSLNDTTVRILVVNEVGPTAGYQYTLKNGTQLPGARSNFIDVDKRTFQITNAGLGYDTIVNRAGKVVTSPTDIEFGGLNRFCSAALFESHQFGAGIGLTDRIFFTGEEDFANGGTMFATDLKTNTLYAVPAFGRATWENITELSTGTTDKVAFLIADDNGNSSLKLFVGNKNAKGDGSFLDRNGLAQGKLYAWVADDPSNPTDEIETNASQFLGTGNSLKGQFVEIPYFNPALANTTGYDALGYATYAKQNELDGALKAYDFQRLEDQATNPTRGNQAVFVTTGVSGTADQWGTTNILDVDFSGIATGKINGNVKIIYDGNDADKRDLGLRNPDNLDWADDGKIYIQEDRAFSTPDGGVNPFGAVSKKEASAFVIDPAAADPAATLTRIYEVDRFAVPSGQTDSSPTDIGNWETSGILDVSKLFGAKPGELFVFDVQAHSIRDGSIITATNLDGNGDGTKTRQENLVEGGQLSFLIAPKANLIQGVSTVAGTSGADSIEAGITKGFDGINDLVFTGAGKDTVDSVIAGALASSNRIDTGSGNDTIYIADADRTFGGSGDDVIEASDAKDYRISGGAGNDTVYLGSNGRALGGDGNDKFFVGTGGGNLITGGAGVDQFWIANGDTPAAANTILDFQVGTDVIGIQGIGATAANVVLAQVGADTTIGYGGQTLATLKGIQASSLTLSNPGQFIFA